MLLKQKFYQRDALQVAHDLIGAQLRLGSIFLCITEVEAYRHGGDTANHCRAGKTARNAPMWGPPGHAYIYLCYGIHMMLNLVTDQEEQGAAVLIRSAMPLAGFEDIVRNRKLIKESKPWVPKPNWTVGPGRVAQALGLDRSWSNHPLFEIEGLEVHAKEQDFPLLVGPRVGIDYASEEDRLAPYRIAMANSIWVSQPKTLRPFKAKTPRSKKV